MGSAGLAGLALPEGHMGEGDIAWVCHSGNDLGAGKALDAGLARQRELSEEHQT